MRGTTLKVTGPDGEPVGYVRAAARAREEAEEKRRAIREKGSGSATVRRDALLAALKPCVAVIPKRSHSPQTATVIIEAAGNSIRVAASDLSTFVEASAPATVKEPFSALANARHLYALLKASPPGCQVSLARDNDRVLLDSDSVIEAEMKWLDPEDWLRVPEWKPGARAEYCGAEFRQLVLRVARAAAADDDARPILTGVSVADAQWAAADGFRLTTARMAPLEGDLGGPVVFLSTGLLAAATAATDDEKVVVEVDEGRGISRVSVDAVTWTGSLIQGNYPDFSKLIPEESWTKVTVPVGAFRQALKTLAPTAKDGSGILRMEAKGSTLMVWAESEDLGKVTVSLLAPLEGEENRIMFNHEYLKDAASLFDDAFTLEWSESSKQAVMRPADRPGLTHVLMPMWVQW